jgi:tetratricopeptide (TPR) repeat protein
LLRLGHGLSEGDPYAKPLGLPIHAASRQAQVLHFPCEFAPSSMQLRLRKVGKPAAGLSFSILENQYEVHRLVEFAKGAVDVSGLGQEWSWVSVPFGTKGKPLFTECYYIALSTTAGISDKIGRCDDCYELAGMQAPPGVQGAAEASFDSGAHRSRASSSADGVAWDDRFEADANVVVTGVDCTPWRPAEAERPKFGPPAGWSQVWQKTQILGLTQRLPPQEGVAAALEAAEQALRASRQAYGEIQPGTAYRLEDLGILQWWAGDLTAAAQSLESALSIQGLALERGDSGRLWLRLAQLEEEHGQLRRSEADVERALELLPGGDAVAACASCQRPQEALGLRSEARRLAYRLRDHLGDKDVLSLLQEDLQDAEKAWPQGSDQVSAAKLRLGLALMESLNWLAEAGSLFSAAAAWQDAHLSPNDPDRASLLVARAQFERRAGKNAEASLLLQRCVELLTKSLAPGQSGYAGRLVELARIQGLAGDKAGAVKNLEQAQAAGLKAFGAGHPLLAWIEFQLGQVTGQASHFQTALQIWSSRYGERHPALAVCRMELERLK